MKDFFTKNVIPQLKKELNIKNIFAVPKLTKVVVNIGIGSYLTRKNKKDYEDIIKDLKMITGQCPAVRKSRKAISNFKLRQGMPVGLTCTLRGQRMYDFTSKLINIALPRIRDFQGLQVKAFDGRGNYSIGIKEHSIFPEINIENVVDIHGLQININTNAKTDYEAFLLLKYMGFPFKDSLHLTNN
ncbi:50S ribosomal protein L5 [Candidatus Peregrinibacteria bacterium RIFOXYB2_FULL_32_7]|nr:MAG: 50S ribosomal protein L5 [Candidatus Peregrinibacteria bacterium RIFOXYB2_FULL_32_7]